LRRHCTAEIIVLYIPVIINKKHSSTNFINEFDLTLTKKWENKIEKEGGRLATL